MKANNSYAYSGPLPAKKLRPVAGTLYDTEWLVQGIYGAQAVFFAMALGAPKHTVGAKTLEDTNMSVSGRLANPLEFTLHKVSYTFEDSLFEGVTFKKNPFRWIWRFLVFCFGISRRRRWLQACAIMRGATFQLFVDDRLLVTLAAGHTSYDCGRLPVRVLTAHPIRAEIKIPKEYKLPVSLKVRVTLEGLLWTPL